MELSNVLVLDDPKLRIDALAAVVRRRPHGAAALASVTQPLVEQLLLYVATSDGCVAQYSVTHQRAPFAVDSLTVGGTSTIVASGGGSSGGPGPKDVPRGDLAASQSASTVTAKLVQKQSLELGKNSVTSMAVETRLKELRLLVLCDGQVSFLHGETLYRLGNTASTLKHLEGSSCACLCQGSQTRMAAYVRKSIVMYSYTDTSILPLEGPRGNAFNVGEGIVALEWLENSILVATKRMYSVFDCHTHQLKDSIVIDKKHPPWIRPVLLAAAVNATSSDVIPLPVWNAMANGGPVRGDTDSDTGSVSGAGGVAPSTAPAAGTGPVVPYGGPPAGAQQPFPAVACRLSNGIALWDAHTESFADATLVNAPMLTDADELGGFQVVEGLWAPIAVGNKVYVRSMLDGNELPFCSTHQGDATNHLHVGLPSDHYLTVSNPALINAAAALQGKREHCILTGSQTLPSAVRCAAYVPPSMISFFATSREVVALAPYTAGRLLHSIIAGSDHHRAVLHTDYLTSSLPVFLASPVSVVVEAQEAPAPPPGGNPTTATSASVGGVTLSLPFLLRRENYLACAYDAWATNRVDDAIEYFAASGCAARFVLRVVPQMLTVLNRVRIAVQSKLLQPSGQTPAASSGSSPNAATVSLQLLGIASVPKAEALVALLMRLRKEAVKAYQHRALALGVSGAAGDADALRLMEDNLAVLDMAIFAFLVTHLIPPAGYNHSVANGSAGGVSGASADGAASSTAAGMDPSTRYERLVSLLLPFNFLAYEESLLLLRQASSLPLDIAAKAGIFLQATKGDVAAALQECRQHLFVDQAVQVLRLFATEDLIAQHLPWMIVQDANVAIQAVIVDPSTLAAVAAFQRQQQGGASASSQPKHKSLKAAATLMVAAGKLGLKGPSTATGSLLAPTAALPPSFVLPFISGGTLECQRTYLHYCVSMMKTKESFIHTLYAVVLVRMLGALTKLAGITRKQLPAKDAARGGGVTRGASEGDALVSRMLELGAGEESGLLGELREDLLEFLSWSTYFDPAEVLATIYALDESVLDDGAVANVFSATERAKRTQSIIIPATTPTMTGAATGAASPAVGGAVAAAATLSTRERLERFYQHWNPEKLTTVDVTLENYAGREQELFALLEKKYGPEPLVASLAAPTAPKANPQGTARPPLPGGGAVLPPAALPNVTPQQTWYSKFLLQEQAMVHARCQDHTSVLVIFVYGLESVEAAERYCFSPMVRNAATTSSFTAVASGSGANRASTASSLMLTSAAGGSGGARSLQGHASGLAPPSGLLVSSGVRGSDRSTLDGAAVGSLSAAEAAQKMSKRSPHRDDGNNPSGEGPSGGPSSGASGGGAVAGTPNRGDVHSSLVLTELIRVLLEPPVGSALRVNEAVRLLDRHRGFVDPLAVLETLPGDLDFSPLVAFFRATLQGQQCSISDGEMAIGARSACLTQDEHHRALLLQRSVFVDVDRPCAVCGKRIGDAVIGVFPNLKVAHFRCFKAKDRDPERFVPFRSVQ